ncbi:MAG: NAD(P)/FAD-dependent oxidoreductase [Holosporales bacterium]|nr:NAD(P)/FAD-dependent oxidoreductase [Holosporales bacterium]
MMRSDVVIIGAGVAGLYAGYCCGISGLSFTIIDSLAKPGGQCIALYPEKKVYGVPGFHDVTACDFIDKLVPQCLAFEHTELFGHTVEMINTEDDGTFVVQTRSMGHAKKPLCISARYVIIAAGICDMKPNIPATIAGLQDISESSDFVQSCCMKIDMYKGKDVAIAGGGDSAVDFALSIIPIAKSVILIHRRDKLTCSAVKLRSISEWERSGKLKLILKTNISELTERGNERVVTITRDDGNRPLSKPSESELLLGGTEHRSGVYLEVHEHSSTGSTQQEADCGGFGMRSNESKLKVDHIIFCYGFVARCHKLTWLHALAPDIKDGMIAVDVNTMETSVKNCYAIGDVVIYANKSKNIVPCFFEADRAVRMIKSKGADAVHKDKRST